MKTYFASTVSTLLSMLLFCSCEPKNDFQPIQEELARLFDLCYSCIGQPSSVLEEEAKASGWDVVITEADNSVRFVIPDKANGMFYNDSLWMVNIHSTIFTTNVNGGRLFLELGNTIFDYGWDQWVAITPNSWEADSSFSNINTRPGYSEYITPFFENLPDDQTCTVDQRYQKTLGSHYLYICYSYKAGKTEPSSDGTEKVRKIEIFITIWLRNDPVAIFEN